MTKIAVLDESYDLFLGYSWDPYGGSQGIGGHLYECIEYYHLLKQHMKVGIFMCTSEGVSLDDIKLTVTDKYNFSEQEVTDLLSDVHFFDPPLALKGNNLLLVDGNFTKLKKIHLLFKNIMMFPCNDRAFSSMTNITAFQDNRIYGEHNHHKHYVKKILFDRYKIINATVENVNLLYIKTGPRQIGEEIYSELENSYSGNFLLVTNLNIDCHLSERFNVVVPPIDNLFSQFSHYIYTPIPRKFDCSSRFIAECAWYNKPVIYHNIDYWDTDKGLYWRKHDIDNDFSSIVLKEDDEIIDLVKDIIYV